MAYVIPSSKTCVMVEQEEKNICSCLLADDMSFKPSFL